MGTWFSKAPYPGPNASVYIGFMLSGKFGVVVGDAEVGRIGEFHVYDPDTNSWSQKQTYPGALYPHFAMSIGNKGYVGSYRRNAGTFDWWEYDLSSNTWTQRTNHPFTVHASGGPSIQTFTIGTKGCAISFVGSSTVPFQSSFYEFDPSANVWTKLAAFPGTYRTLAVGGALNDLGYLVSGITPIPAGASFLRDVWRYNRTSNSWTQLGDFGGQGRAYASSFALQGRLYVGLGDIGAGGNLKDFWAFNPATQIWTVIADFGGGKRWGAASADGYVAAGHVGIAHAKDFWLYSNPPAGRTLKYRWGIRTLVSNVSHLLWKVARDPVGKTNKLLWVVKSAVGNTSKCRWHIGGVVGRKNKLVWNIKPVVGNTVKCRWKLFNPPVGKTNKLRWDVRTAAGKTNKVRWRKGPTCNATIEFTVFGQSGSTSKSEKAKFADCVP